MRKIFTLVFFVLCLFQANLSFAATQTKKITVVYLSSKPGVSESIYKTVYLTPVSIKKVDYLPAKELVKAFRIDSKWYSRENAFALSANNIFAAVSPRRQNLVISKHNRLYNSTCPTVDKNGSLQLPISILENLNIKTSKDSTIYYVYPSSIKHVYEKSLDNFVKKTNLYLTNKPKIMSQYTTYFNSGNKNRTTNIYQSSAYINGLIIPPGQTFSFNKIVGPRSASTGYKKAIIFFKNEKTEDYGGGICQVSSTIYNAVYRSKLTVLQRKSHSLDITYVPKGMDATVSYGYIDFVFKNNKPYPILLNSEPQGNRLTVKISRF